MAQLTRLIRRSRRPHAVERASTLQVASPDAVTRRRVRLFALLGAVSYALALLATLPAELLFEEAEEDALVGTVTGTVWSGEASLNGGHGVRWAWSPFESLANLAFLVDFEMIGPGTQMEGEALWRPSSFQLQQVRGRSTGALINALFPKLPFACDFPMNVEIEKIVLGEERAALDGEIRTAGGLCSSRGPGMTATSIVPPLLAQSAYSVGGSKGSIATASGLRERIVSSTITPNGEVSLTISPRGAALLPGGFRTNVTIRTRL